MAVNVSANEEFTGWIVVSCLDTNGKLTSRTKEYELGSGVTLYADAISALVALAGHLDGVNEADITEYGIRAKFPSNGTLPTVVGNVYKEVVLTLQPDGVGDKITHTIYSPDDTLAPSGGGVNTGYAALATYLNNFETGGDFTLSDGETIAATNQIASARIRRVASKDN